MTDFKRVFVDTAPIIYYLENNAQYKDAIKRFFTNCLEKDIQLVTSALTIEEYLVFPYLRTISKDLLNIWVLRL